MILYILLLFVIVISIIFKFGEKNIQEKFRKNDPFSGWTNDQYKSLFYTYKPCSDKKFKIINTSNLTKINPKNFLPIPYKYHEKFDWSNGVGTANSDTNISTDNYYYNYLGKNIMSSVKNQGYCGCCYAIATAGVIESSYYLSLLGFGKLKEFSIQQIIDCTSSDENISCNPNKPSKGCGGGDLLNIVNTYFTIYRKIAFDSDYSYTSFYNTNKNPPPAVLENGEFIQLINYDFNQGNINCDTKLDNLDNFFFDHIFLKPLTAIIIDKEEYLKSAIYKYGPVYVSYLGGVYDDNGYFPFKNYPYDEKDEFKSNKYISEAGVYLGPSSFPGSSSNLHAMILTGWGKDTSYGTNQNYWIVKNSWGKYWGLSGYIRLAMNNNVFIDMYAISFQRPACDSDNTFISIKTNPSYSPSAKNLKFSVGIIFKAHRQSLDNKISIEIKAKSKVENKELKYIVPVYNPDSLEPNPVPLKNKLNNNIQDDDEYYFNKDINNNFIKSDKKSGLWFQGEYRMFALSNVTPPILDDSYIWYLKLQIIDTNNKIISEDQTEINWKNAFII